VEIEGRLIKALLDNDIPFDENKINYTHAWWRPCKPLVTHFAWFTAAPLIHIYFPCLAAYGRDRNQRQSKTLAKPPLKGTWLPHFKIPYFHRPIILFHYLSLIPHLKLRSYSYFINHYNLVVEKVAFYLHSKNEKMK
jgi:hypothetical protein